MTTEAKDYPAGPASRKEVALIQQRASSSRFEDLVRRRDTLSEQLRQVGSRARIGEEDDQAEEDLRKELSLVEQEIRMIASAC